MILIWVMGCTCICLAGLIGWRQFDHHVDRVEMERLLATQPADPAHFDADIVADLPEPARRFFTFAISEGTPLYTVANLEMAGQFGMGDTGAPGYIPMVATQVLAAPHGFVWTMSAGNGAMRMAGSDSASWTRFWLFGLVPVARFGGDRDHTRSAFGRYVAEAVFWTPAAVLPGPNVTWEAVSGNTARMTMRHAGLEQAVDVTVAENGQPLYVAFQRWSDANPEKVHRLQPFGGYLSEFRDFGGFRLPTHVEAGNHFETETYFPFFIADVSEITFPQIDP
ncbi:hypothetical protein SAMN05443432_1042 [Roseovarius litoreus]|uniref:Uncharacterized protein n=1 Tax=Roseovarius litoreus TaxID=1155722 RepID=A0A1M7F1G2_9RHOB|nr:DUF6544 family protein [Roseovarius litoreus]SHL97786.1 hypothetical protein SAMN05443432_1042 [Roseovarius litoreus]